ncbi:[FeFe] hydrogenase H-cluster radical SAM maturase HydE [Clostridiisalibacter paucivorans]|uniref:[FeFe] hydrogenase H-cluster radical SAM maturase HydE n=1 Tax=Clostridiisalibacter paucivorans TaxID=408753 RepID=UPI00047CEA64|nr:[FeFe] hydrogenase H-cluster radical SAM maturase HydE [Clostridiisalibacter paucivorans]
MKRLIDKLHIESNLSKNELLNLLNNMTSKDIIYLKEKANMVRNKHYQNKVFLRGLIEFTNHCKSHCIYCGINAKNSLAHRYRLSKEDILNCCNTGYKLGYRTFVLQGGEDPYFTDDKMVDIIETIKTQYPHCAITLSIGEKSYQSYKRFYDSGADRYLLRHETASKSLYESLHPNMSFENRIRCLYDLKSIGYQVGAGFMVGLPNQTNEDLVQDLLFLKKLGPHMVGIGPFIPHEDTILRNCSSGTVDKTAILLAMIRLILPDVLLPATTALGTLHPTGREKGLKSGANVVMPNLSPTNVREKYSLYNGKICTGEEAAECMNCIKGRIESSGFILDFSRGDNINWKRKY